MSTQAVVDVRALEEAAERAAQEVQRRKLMEIRLQSEQMSLQLQAGIQQAQQSQIRLGLQTSSLQADMQGIQITLAQTQRELSAAQERLYAASTSAQHTAKQLTSLQQGLDSAIHNAYTTLQKNQAAMAQSQSTLQSLGVELRLSHQAQATWDANRAELKRIQDEIHFLTHDPALLTPAALTLMSMSANGYVLSQMLPQEGLIAYFEKADQSHQIAVRTRLAGTTPVKSLTQWEVEVETFGLIGDECLDVLDDFIATSEETGLAEVELTQRRYPKPEGLQVLLPLPSAATDPEKGSENRSAQHRRQRE